MILTKRLVFGLTISICGAAAQSRQAPACDPNNGGITLPAGFCAFVAADGLGAGRHMAVAANGDLYLALQDKGGVVALRDTNGDGRFEMKARRCSRDCGEGSAGRSPTRGQGPDL